MFPQNTIKERDEGCSGATAFFTGNWAGSDQHYTDRYKGFNLSATFRGYRWASKRSTDWNAMKNDWKNAIDTELGEYEASNWSDYRKKYREREKTEKEEQKKEREQRENKAYANATGEDGKDSGGNDTYQGLLKKIDELEKNNIKTLELKEKDMKEIMAKIEEKNKKELDEINKQIELKNEEITKLFEQSKRAREDNDKAAQNRINVLIRKHQEELVSLDKQKKELPTDNDLKEYLKLSSDNSPIFDFKSKRFWIFSAIALTALIVIILIVVWIIKKVSSILKS